MSPAAISRRLASGRWILIYPNVYLVGAGRIGRKTRLMAACRWAGPDAVISHTSAAELLGLEPGRAGRVTLTTPGKKNSAHGIEVYQDVTMATERIVKVDGIPTTTVERTILDLCRIFERMRAVTLIERAIREGRTNLPRLARVLGTGGAPNRRGGRTLQWVLRNRFAIGVTDSEAEDLFIRLARTHGAPRGYVHHHVVHDAGRHIAELDFAYLEELVDIEVDGDEFHADPASVQRDKRRDALLIEMGWIVLRFTYWQLVREPEWVFERIRKTVALRRAA
jgi:hypothetical protein